MNVHSKIGVNRFWTISEFIVKTGLSFGLLIIIAKNLGVVELGMFSYWLTVSGLLTGLAKLGLDSIILREVPVMTNANVLLIPSVKTSTYAALFLFIISAIIHYYTLESTEYLGFLFITGGIIFSSYNVYDSFYKAIEESKTNFIIKVPIMLSFFLLKAYVALSLKRLEVLALAIFLENLVIFLVYQFRYSNAFEDQIGNTQKSFIKEHLKAIIKITLSSIIALLYLRTDTIAIKYILSDAELGIYSAGARVVEFILSVVALYSIALAPSISQNINNSYKLSRILRKFTLQSFIIWVIGLMILYAFGREIMYLLFGAEFTLSYEVVWVYYLFVVLAAVGSILQRILFAFKDDNYVFYKSLISFLLNLILNLILVPRIGLMGAVYATGIVLTVSNIIFPLAIEKYRNLIWLSFCR